MRKSNRRYAALIASLVPIISLVAILSHGSGISTVLLDAFSGVLIGLAIVLLTVLARKRCTE